MRSSEALILLDLERPADARAVYDELIPLYRASFGEGDIYSASGHLWRAECHTRLGEREEAEQQLRRGLAFEDVVPDARHLQAIREELARLETVD